MGRSSRRWLVGRVTPLIVALAWGCELDEVTVVEVEDVVVAEVYVQADMPAPGAAATRGAVRAFLHRTVGGATSPRGVPGAAVTITRDDGGRHVLTEAALGECVEIAPVGATGTCYTADSAEANALLPGSRLELDIVLPDGGALEGVTRIPGAFDIDGIDDLCVLPPDVNTELTWSGSEGAWAYVNETSIAGLSGALSSEGIESPDPLYLLGLSVSSGDTTIVFPSEFGLFDRFDLDQDLAIRLQLGLPPGIDVLADVAITASDRNYVNWARGGTFNPSGQVRVPSVLGDGTGVFAATLSRHFRIGVADPDSDPRARCPAF